MKTFRCMAIATAVLILTACPEVDETREAVEGEDPDPPVVALPPATGEDQTFVLAPERGERIGGEVRVGPSIDGEGQVAIEVRAAPTNTVLRPAVHEGTCQMPGPPVSPLDLIHTTGEGAGASTTQVQLTPEQLTDGSHVVQIVTDVADPARADERRDDEREARVLGCAVLGDEF